MSRNFGIMSGHASLSGASSTDVPASIGKYAPSNSILLSPADPPLPRGQLVQAMLDVLMVSFAFLFLSVAGCGLAFVLFVLLFVRVG